MKDLARRADVTIYTVRLGLYAAAIPKSAPGRQIFEAAYTMRTLAREARGRDFVPTAAVELPAVYTAIAEELATQYQVGYVPSRPFGDGGFRQVVVRIAPPTSAVARTRLGYVASPNAITVGRSVRPSFEPASASSPTIDGPLISLTAGHRYEDSHQQRPG